MTNRLRLKGRVISVC